MDSLILELKEEIIKSLNLEEMTPEDIFMNKEKRKRVTKSKDNYEKSEWIWEDEK